MNWEEGNCAHQLLNKGHPMNIPIVFSYSLLSGLTAVYCMLIWYGSGLWWSSYASSEPYKLPLISLLSLAPLPLPIWWTMIHWQALAIISLVISIYWGRKRCSQLGGDEGYTLPITIHTLFIFFAVCCHLLGAMLPMLSIGHVIIK